MSTPVKPSHILLFFLLLPATLISQHIPGIEENIEGFVVYGKTANPPGGEDQYQQHIYLVVPVEYRGLLSVRVFDPDTGGQNDLVKGDADTNVKYTLYGGQGAYWDGNLDNQKASGNGTMLDNVIIGPESESDNSFKTLFIVDPRKGEYRTDFNAYIFRLECQGQAGDDGNVYKVFLSTDPHRNISVEGAISFRYTNSLLLRDAPETGHLYPYMDLSIQRIEGSIHGLEPGKDIIMFSRERRGQLIKTVSTRENTFSFEVLEEEKGLSLDFHFPVRTGNSYQQRQSIFINAISQSDSYVPFYSSPIGGTPRYSPDVSYEPIL